MRISRYGFMTVGLGMILIFVISTFAQNGLESASTNADTEEDRVTICHVNPAQGIILEDMPLSSLNGHFDNNGNLHRDDFFINSEDDRQRCENIGNPPEETPEITPEVTPEEEDRVTICHVNPAQGIILENMPLSSLNGHFDNNGNLHNDDFFINSEDDRQRCENIGNPPEETPEITPEVTPEITPTDTATPEVTPEITPEVTPEEEDRVTICHVNPAQGIILENMPLSSLNGHFDNNGNLHNDDFFINSEDDRQRCENIGNPPEETPEMTPEITPEVTPEITPTDTATPEVTPEITPEVTPEEEDRVTICHVNPAQGIILENMPLSSLNGHFDNNGNLHNDDFFINSEDDRQRCENIGNPPEETPEITPEVTPEITPTDTATPEVTPEITPTDTATPEVTPEITPEVTPEITPTDTVTPEVTPEITPTDTVTPEVTPEITPTDTVTPEVTPVITPEPTPDVTPEPTEPPFVTEEPYVTEEWSDEHRDSDWDGFPDSEDACPWLGNEEGLGVDETGCPYYDADWDGYFDRNDSCPWQGNEEGLGVDETGCPYYDADWDGFYDRDDACPWQGNENGSGVDETGCPIEYSGEAYSTEEPYVTQEWSDEYRDADWDGFPDEIDACPSRGNEGGLGVDETGCPYYDADWDGIYDRDDACPSRGNEYGFGIDETGCPIEIDSSNNATEESIATAEPAQ